MKKILLALIIAVCTSGLQAQDLTENEVDYVQAMYGKEKKVLVSEFLKLDDAQADEFWPVYEAYEADRKELGKKRIELLEYLSKNNESMTEDKADYWMREMISLGNKTDKLLKSYYGKTKRATNSIIAARFVQIESYLLTAQRFAIQDALPVVGGQLQ